MSCRIETSRLWEGDTCEAHFMRTVSRDDSGRYTVRLPFRETERHLGESRAIALKRLTALERRFLVDASLKTEYTRIIEEYLKLNYLSEVVDPNNYGYYMPHHAVSKATSNTTKVRIVFDASAKSGNGLSLNDILLVGPTIQDKLFAHLIRFRAYKYVITADIEKMYLRIRLHEDDRRYQRILWRKDDKITTFQFNMLTFGVSSSPFLAIRALQKLADDEGHAFPKAAKVIKTHLYVDDLISGADSIDEVRAIRYEVIALLARGGFTIRQWASNEERVVSDLADDTLHAGFAFGEYRFLKTLGLTWPWWKYTSHALNAAIMRNGSPCIFPPWTWRARDDEIRYLVQPIEFTERFTKRRILSEIAKIFDPLRLLGPVVFYAKGLMQEIWRHRLNWDESVPQSIHTAWLEFVQQLGIISQISFDRKLVTDNYRDVQVHGFCDASNKGYGACIYVRSLGKDRNTTVRLLCAKSRVAPLKNVTIPRLELCGALLLARLYRELLNTFVANRVREVQELAPSNEWRYVRSENNPADGISRGQLPRVFSRNRMWFTGPTWLSKDEDEWPDNLVQINEILELRRNTCLLISNEPEIIERFSSYSKLLRVVAYCLRMLPINTHTGSLCIKEIDEAERRVLRIVQATRFSNEIRILQGKNPVIKNKFANLNPFLDDQGLIRVGGRLQNSDATFSRKHPILLPSRHNLTDRIIRETHEKNHHSGIQTTLYIPRQKFWLTDGRNQSSDQGLYMHLRMTIKAVHLEVVSDLTSDGFLAVLRRFVARRGMPEHIYSDNGTNFVGANKQLREMYALFNSDQHKEQVNKFACNHRITWHFIPPAAPHFGGLWESMVKLFKHHFKRVVGDSLFTFKELNTFTIKIESILNSRPITILSCDLNDLLVLSPAHYLIGKRLTALPEGNLTSVPANRLSTWQHISKVRQHFWARWNLEYLNELQVRVKWVKDEPQFVTGAVVLIKDKNLPCNQWALGRITKIHPGDDGRVRAATVKTANGE
ncbi:PREDICTED: uncharacterized protein LOC108767167, partial [Trachymyrmex cornetzi]|uniref:uncharacterized protein LOC108767167 n=1 Tax=Trachymyrmex cornetzi TaxID=471704 RepID=UPI00084F3E9B